MRFRVLVIGSILLFLLALVSFGLANVARPANRASEAPSATAVPAVGPLTVADRSSAAFQNRPYTPSLQNSADPTVLAVVGEFGNGGKWTWEDMVNLLGVYGSPNVFRHITWNGRQYDGVPLTHLLDYAQINDYAVTIAIKDREDQIFDFSAKQIQTCFDCLVVLTEEDTLLLVLPGLVPDTIQPLMRITAYAQGDYQASAPRIPPDPQSILLFGNFARTGSWTWEDLSNLLGLYAGYNNYLTVEVEGTVFSGVPLRDLLDFAQLEQSARTLILTDREQKRIAAAASALRSCQYCMLALTDNETIALILPDMEPSVIPQIANIDAR